MKRIIQFLIIYILSGGQVMAHKEIKTEIVINASNKDVWKVLNDFKSYPEWNPFILEISGKKEVREKLKVSLLLKESKTFNIKPKIQNVIENEYFEWYGTSPLWFFNGRHYFKIEKINETQVMFIHGEKFTGWLAKFVLRKIGEDTKKGFINMNRALKERIENNK